MFTLYWEGIVPNLSDMQGFNERDSILSGVATKKVGLKFSKFSQKDTL